MHRTRKPVVRHSFDLDHVAAHPIGALPAYTDLAEFQPRRGRGEIKFKIKTPYLTSLLM